MNRLDRLIGYFDPRAAEKRIAARYRIEGYAAATDTRLRRIRRTTTAPNYNTKIAAKRLREQARAFEEDSDIAKRALDLVVQNVIGQGVIPEPTARLADGTIARDFNRELGRLHREWRRRPESTHRMGYAPAQQLAVRTWIRDGEYLAQHIRGNVPNFQHASSVRYSFEMIEPDRLADEFDSETGKQPGRVIQGIAVNGWGEPQAYFIYPYHPAEIGITGGTRGDFKPNRKAAADILHVATTSRISQLRGISQFAQVMSRLEDVNEVDEAERVGIRIASSIALAIYDPNAPRGSGDAIDTDPDNTRATDWAPGMVLQYSDPDARAEVLESKRPNDQMIPWRKSQLQAIAGGMGVGYSSLAADYIGSYSSQRQELVETAASYGILWAFWVDQVEEPIYREFVTLAMLASPELRSLRGAIDERTLFDAEWSRPALPWVDPEKEARAFETLYRLGIITKARMIRERGGVPDEVTEQVAEEKRRDAELAAELAPEPAPGQDGAADDEQTDDTEAA
jgi:lambda family phage portal protein